MYEPLTEIRKDEIYLPDIIRNMYHSKSILLYYILPSIILSVILINLNNATYKTTAKLQIERKLDGDATSVVDNNNFFYFNSSILAEIEIMKSYKNIFDIIKKNGLNYKIEPLDDNIINDDYITFKKFISPGDGNYKIKVINNENYLFIDENRKVEILGKVGCEVITKDYIISISEIKSYPGQYFYFKKTNIDMMTEVTKSRINIIESPEGSGIISISLDGIEPEKDELIIDELIKSYLSLNYKKSKLKAEDALKLLEQRLLSSGNRIQSLEENLSHLLIENETLDISETAKNISDSILDIENELLEIRLKENDIKRNFTASHPYYKSIKNSKFDLIEKKEELQSKLKELPVINKNIMKIRREIEVNNDIYANLLEKHNELILIKNGNVGNAIVVEDTLSSSEPIKIDNKLLVIFSFLLCNFLGLFHILIRMMYGEKIIHGINDIKVNNLSFLYKYKHSQEKESEVYRSIRTDILLNPLSKSSNVIAIISSEGFRDKYSVIKELAISFSNDSVLIVDCDIENGNIHESFGLDANIGLSSYLEGKVDYSDIKLKTDICGVDLIPRGKIVLDTSMLLIKDDFNKLISLSKNDYKTIILNSPSTIEKNDYTIMCKHSNVNVMIEKKGLSKVENIKRFNDILGMDNINGLVFIT